MGSSFFNFFYIYLCYNFSMKIKSENHVFFNKEEVEHIRNTIELNCAFDIYISYYDDFKENDVLYEIIKKQQINLSDDEKFTCNLLLNYIESTQKTGIGQINNIRKYNVDRYMQLDVATRKNLEIRR